MSMAMAGIPSTQAALELSRSALPDAPVVPDPPRARRRDRVGVLLRAMARYELRLADRIAPIPG